MRLGFAAAAVSLLLAVPAVALAYGVQAPEQALLWAWPIGVDAIIGLLAAAALYAQGVKALHEKSASLHRWRHWAFFGGLVAIFLALVTPLDVIAEHLFAVHQIQHLLLRGVAPMLLMLAVPAGPLIAGMPAFARRRWLMPIMSKPAVRDVFRALSQPVICTVLYAGTLYAWQVPAVHDAALLDGALHYAMHLTMLISGLLFFWRVFDPRPAPWGAPFQQRLVMLGAAMFANIPLGAVITLKDRVAYTAYDHFGRWWGIAPLQDEQLGGLVIWILGSMMGLLAVLWLVALWGRTEARQDDRRQQGFRPPHDSKADPDPAAAELAARRRMGWSIAIVPLAVGVAMVALAVWISASTVSPLY
jgi:putative membrane protein